MPKTVKEPRDLFLEKLANALYVEQAMAKEVLPKLAKEAGHKKLSEGAERHAKQTRRHAANLQKVFGKLGEAPRAEKSPALEGLKRQREQVSKRIQDADLRDLANASAAADNEHLEISAYRSLVDLATALGETEAKRLLQDNLKQEEEMLRELERVAKELGRKSKRAGR